MVPPNVVYKLLTATIGGVYSKDVGKSSSKGRDMAEPIHVDGWPMDTYPFRHPVSLEPVSNFFKASILEKDGRTSFHLWESNVYDPSTGKTIHAKGATHPKSWAVTTAKGMPGKYDGDDFDGMKDHIPPVDLRVLEEKIGGKPTIVQMGLWAEWDGTRWKKLDMTKLPSPLYYINVTDKYYDKWRKEAYRNEHDPYEGQHRPYTKFDDERNQLNDLKRQLAEKEKELARLVAEKNRRIVENPVEGEGQDPQTQAVKKRGRPKKVK